MIDMLPEPTVIKLSRIRLAGSVVDVLHVNKDGDFFQSKLLVIKKRINDSTFYITNDLLVVDHLV